MRRLAFSLLLLAAPLVAQSAPAHPDFSGKWTLDLTKSGAQAMGPASAVLTVTQTDKAVKVEQVVTSQMGTQNTTINYTLDGAPSKNTVNNGGMTLELTSTAVWDGPALVVTTKAEVQGQQYQEVGRWTLDADGKTLTQAVEASFGAQTMPSRKQVFNKS